MDIGKYISALERRIGFELDEPDDGFYGLVVEGTQLVNIGFDETAATITIRTPVNAYSPALPADLVASLLELNLPNGVTAGAMLAWPEDGFGLELVNVIPAAAIEPDRLGDLAGAQGKGALEVSRIINRKLAHAA
ncbi:type III secretion system chaperone [Prosthecomicrobium hirschii]|uniref:type III secretion system chaperone n=1 Tax=Prosthecodimorpha hirschii TaxID=665126 RepID=UPI00221F005E|nr:type III secretion system chaperone [Prosthecomicrobium hirschii]MCW1839798.1 type III secretion system chaperone [Prosthecomicrobium hirschii]